MDFLDALARMRTEGEGAPLPDDDAAREAYPILWALLTRRTCLDDQSKLPARVTISVGMGAWCVGLYDESLAVSVETTAPHLGAAFQALEAKIPDLQAWRINKRRKPKLKPAPAEPGKNGLTKRKK